MDEFSRSVRTMFGQISKTYDILNRILSLGLDASWRRAMAVSLVNGLFRSAVGARGNGTGAMTPGKKRIRILDIASGTGDSAVATIRAMARDKNAFKSAFFVCADFSLPMLEIAKKKIPSALPSMADNVGFVVCDAMKPCFRDGAFDGATVAFGLRNFPAAEGFSSACARILGPCGKLVVLEFSNIFSAPVSAVIKKYYDAVVRKVGAAISGHSFAYSYLVESILAFPKDAEIAAAITRGGLAVVERFRLFPGIVTIYAASKDNDK